jgi:hypothetical protein
LTFNKELLQDIKYAKSFYGEVYTIFRQNDEEEFFIAELKNIAEIQQTCNFKKITGFDISDTHIDSGKSKIETTKQLINKLNFLIKLKSIEEIANKSKVSKEVIESVLRIKDDIKLKDLNSLIKHVNLPIALAEGRLTRKVVIDVK